MEKIKYTLLKKFLLLFIKNTDLTEQEDRELFNTLQIINNHEPLEN